MLKLIAQLFEGRSGVSPAKKAQAEREAMRDAQRELASLQVAALFSPNELAILREYNDARLAHMAHGMRNVAGKSTEELAIMDVEGLLIGKRYAEAQRAYQSIIEAAPRISGKGALN